MNYFYFYFTDKEQSIEDDEGAWEDNLPLGTKFNQAHFHSHDATENDKKIVKTSKSLIQLQADIDVLHSDEVTIIMEAVYFE